MATSLPTPTTGLSGRVELLIYLRLIHWYSTRTWYQYLAFCWTFFCLYSIRIYYLFGPESANPRSRFSREETCLNHPYLAMVKNTMGFLKQKNVVNPPILQFPWWFWVCRKDMKRPYREEVAWGHSWICIYIYIQLFT